MYDMFAPNKKGALENKEPMLEATQKNHIHKDTGY